jgi:glycosyltransferase involved in cell wall biosynthesis
VSGRLPTEFGAAGAGCVSGRLPTEFGAAGAARMIGENVVCFAKDWDGHPTSNTHLMRLLARCNRVLWLESVAMRVPQLASSRDLRRMARRLATAACGARRVEADLWVASPLVLPLPHSRWAAALNRWVLRRTVGRLCRRLGMGRFQVWTFLPTAGDHARALGGRPLVYYCVDDWAHSPDYDGARLVEAEARLCQAADVVFATSQALAADKRRWNPQTHHAPHGVDHAHFARALDPALPVAAEVACLRRPVLAVVGLLDWRIDTGLLAALADRRPDWSLALVGPALADLDALATRPNVHVLGRLPYARLPNLLKGCAVGLIPFVVDEYTRHIDPVKLREYLSAGLPVVATALPEVAAIDSSCRIVRSVDELVAAVEAALRDGGPEARSRRSRAMASETWQARVEALGAHLMRLCAVEAAHAADSRQTSAPEAPAA